MLQAFAIHFYRRIFKTCNSSHYHHIFLQFSVISNYVLIHLYFVSNYQRDAEKNNCSCLEKIKSFWYVLKLFTPTINDFLKILRNIN